MELQQYVALATRTESVIESVRTCEYTLKTTLEAFELVSSLLDRIKKNVYYNKPIDAKLWEEDVYVLSRLANDIPLDPPSQQDGVVDVDPRLFHGVIGILTESGELADALLLSLCKKQPIDGINVLEELGDLAWYQAIIIDSTGAYWDDILEKNISKLRQRYPLKFTSEAAINRDVQAERTILDTMTIK